MSRTSHKEVVYQFLMLAAALDVKVATNDDNLRCISEHGPFNGLRPVDYMAHIKAEPSSAARDAMFVLDYNPVYGGYVIGLLKPGSSGQWEPFGPMRRKAGDMVDTIRFARISLGWAP